MHICTPLTQASIWEGIHVVDVSDFLDPDDRNVSADRESDRESLFKALSIQLMYNHDLRSNEKLGLPTLIKFPILQWERGGWESCSRSAFQRVSLSWYRFVRNTCPCLLFFLKDDKEGVTQKKTHGRIAALFFCAKFQSVLDLIKEHLGHKFLSVNFRTRFVIKECSQESSKNLLCLWIFFSIPGTQAQPLLQYPSMQFSCELNFSTTFVIERGFHHKKTDQIFFLLVSSPCTQILVHTPKGPVTTTLLTYTWVIQFLVGYISILLILSKSASKSRNSITLSFSSGGAHFGAKLS